MHFASRSDPSPRRGKLYQCELFLENDPAVSARIYDALMKNAQFQSTIKTTTLFSDGGRAEKNWKSANKNFARPSEIFHICTNEDCFQILQESLFRKKQMMQGTDYHA